MIATILTFLMCSSIGLTVSNLSTNEINYVSNDISNYCQSRAIDEGIESPSSEIYVVNDLHNNEFYIQTGEENGFMVFDPVVSNFIEKSASFDSPYDFSINADYYYFGPMNYYEKIGNLFYSLINDNEYFDLDYAYELQNIFCTSQ